MSGKMKTEQMMVRELGDIQVRQSNQTEMFNVTDLVAGYNEKRASMGLTEKRLDKYWANDSTKEFMEALEKDYELNTTKSGDLKVSRRGKQGGTYVVPEIFVDIAMWLNPEFKVKVMRWVVDGLLNARNTSGVQYSLMTNALKEKFPNKNTQWFIVRIGKLVKKALLEEGQDWQTASEAQLEARVALQQKIINACELLDDGISADEFCNRVFKVKAIA